MKTLRLSLVLVSVFSAICGHARAADPTRSINFVGDSCYSSQDGRETSYQLPSWTEDGHCTKILSIDQWSFYGEGRHCEPVNIRQRSDTAPSGISYMATTTARCQPDGSVGPGKIQTYEFMRYKGNLTVTVK
jgi:hypothetical protein